MKKLVATLAISTVLFSGCSLKQDAVIKINDKVITQSQYDKLFDKQADNSVFARMGVNIKENPNGFMYLMIQERVINELIVKTLLEEELVKRNIKVTKDDVDNAVKEIIDKIGSKEQLNMILKHNGISTAQFRKDLTEEVKMKKLAEQLGKSDVSDAEAQKFYKENVDKFKYPAKVRASHILVAADPDEIKEVITSDSKNKDLTVAQVKAKVNEEMNARKAKADKLYNQAKANVNDFAKLAKENSDDATTAVKGGDLGFFASEEMVSEFSKAAFAQRPNSVSPVVKTKFGYHVILVTDRMEAGQEPFEKAKTDIKNYLTNQKQLQLLDDLTESLKKNAKIEYVKAEYSPQTIQDKLQNQVKKQTEANKPKAKATAKAPAKKVEAKAPAKTEAPKAETKPVEKK